MTETENPGVTLFLEELAAAAGKSAFRIAVPAANFKALNPPFYPEFVGPRGGPYLGGGVRSLIPQGTTSAAGVEAIRETSYTDNSAVVVPPSVKPESTFTFENRLSPVATLANTIRMSRQILDDVPGLRSMLASRLLFGLKELEDQQLLNGTGVNGEVVGLIPSAIPSGGAVTPPLLADAVLAGIEALAVAGYLATGVVLNPVDWAGLIKGKAADAFLLQSSGVRTIWGFPLVLSPKMPANQFLVGDFTQCQIFDREEAAMLIATMNKDDFIKNMLTARAEERFAFVVYQPGAFRKAGP